MFFGDGKKARAQEKQDRQAAHIEKFSAIRSAINLRFLSLAFLRVETNREQFEQDFTNCFKLARGLLEVGDVKLMHKNFGVIDLQICKTSSKLLISFDDDDKESEETKNSIY